MFRAIDWTSMHELHYSCSPWNSCPALHLPGLSTLRPVAGLQSMLRCAALHHGERGEGLRGHCVWQAPRAACQGHEVQGRLHGLLGEPVRQYIDSAVRHVMLRQGVLGIKVCSPISHVHLRGLLLTTIVAKCSLSYLMYQRLVTAESVPLDGSSGSPLTASDDAETVPTELLSCASV